MSDDGRTPRSDYEALDGKRPDCALIFDGAGNLIKGGIEVNYAITSGMGTGPLMLVYFEEPKNAALCFNLIGLQ